jgi:tetratricopeptide (TPR) repeat protein
MRIRVLFILLATTVALSAQQSTSEPNTTPQAKIKPKSNTASAPRSDDEPESSSKDTKIDLSPPKGDSTNHPNSGVADEVMELHPYNPLKAIKDVEVADYHYRNHNYPAAISRYREALEFKPMDAVATFGLAQSLEKNGNRDEARDQYAAYLKILPNGPQAADCHKAIDRLSKPTKAKK